MLDSRLAWTVAWVCAVAAPVLYLLEPRWVFAPLLLPLLGMAAWRSERRGFDDHGPDGGSVPQGPL